MIFCGELPTASVEDGRGDVQLRSLLEKLLGNSGEPQSSDSILRNFPGGGFCAFLPKDVDRLPELIGKHIARDFIPEQPNVYVTHRRVGKTDVYLLQNTLPDDNLRLRSSAACCASAWVR